MLKIRLAELEKSPRGGRNRRLQRESSSPDSLDSDISAYLVEFRAKTNAIGFNELLRDDNAGIASLLNVVPIFLGNQTAKSDEVASQADSDTLKRLYAELDADEDGFITAQEMHTGLNSLGLSMPMKDVEALVREGDTNGDNVLDWQEFLDVIVARRRASAGGDKSKPLKFEKARARLGKLRSKSMANINPVLPGSTRCSQLYDRCSRMAKTCVEHPLFEPLIIACIMLVGAAAMVELEFLAENVDTKSYSSLSLPQQALVRFLEIAHTITLSVFTAEVILKIAAQHAQGKTPLFFFTDKQNGTFNMFDFGIVAVSYVFIIGGVNGGELITVLRLLRLLKIATRMPQLRTILLGLVAGVTAVGSILVLLSLITYLFAIVGVLLFGENDPGHFGRVGQAILTLFQCATLAAWRDIFLVNYFGCDKYDMDLYTETTHPSKIHTELGWFYAYSCSEPKHDRHIVATIFFMCFTVLAAFVVLSLFISVITMAMFEIMEMKAHEKKVTHLFQDGRMPAEKRRAMHAAFDDDSTEFGEAISHVFDTAATAKQTSRYKQCKEWCQKVSSHHAFQTTVVTAIMLTGVLEGIETDSIADQRMRKETIEDTPLDQNCQRRHPRPVHV